MAKCGKECEVWSRIVGYYRPLLDWNEGKQKEFGDRLVFNEKKIKEGLDRVRPFSSGTQWIDWQDRNCCECKRIPEDEWRSERGVAWGLCELYDALCEASINDGTISYLQAEAIGAIKFKGYFIWDCMSKLDE